MGTRRRRVILKALLTMLAAVVAGWAAANAAEESNGDTVAQSVRVVVRFGETGDGSRGAVRAVEMVILDGGGPSAVETGWRVPIATGAGETGSAVSYQHVGLSVRLRARILGEGRVEVRGRIEESSIEDRAALATSAMTPTMRSFSQELSAMLVEGEPMRVGSIVDGSGGTAFVEIEVDVLD